MNLLDVLRELVCEQAKVMGSDWTGYHRIPPQRDGWHPPAVLVDRADVQFEGTLAQALVTADLIFVADSSGTDTDDPDAQVYSVASLGPEGKAEALAAVTSPNGLWTDIAAENATIAYREIGQNVYLAAVMPVQILCPHTPTPPA